MIDVVVDDLSEHYQHMLNPSICAKDMQKWPCSYERLKQFVSTFDKEELEEAIDRLATDYDGGR